MSQIKTKFIADNNVTNAKLAQVATATFKGRTTAGTGNSEDLTATQATALLSNMVGDSGSGGSKGLAPAPAAGDAAAGKFLKADGTWAAVASGTTGDIPHTSFTASNNVSSAANVTGLAFANASVRSAEVLYSIALVATASKYQVGKLLLVQRGADWQLSEQYAGDDAGFAFTVTTAGQVQYTSPNSAGFTSATIKFRAIVTNV
jgi:hypothetical protein